MHCVSYGHLLSWVGVYILTLTWILNLLDRRWKLEHLNKHLFLCFVLHVASPHPRSALPPGGLHRGRGLPRGCFHSREALLLLLFLPVVPQWEVPRGWQRIHVGTGRRAHQHASPRQWWRKSSDRQPRGHWAASAGQYCLSGSCFDWYFIRLWSLKTSNVFSLLLGGLICAFIIRRLWLMALKATRSVCGRTCILVTGRAAKNEQVVYWCFECKVNRVSTI